MRYRIATILLLALLVSCNKKETSSIGSLEKLEPEFDAIVSPDAKIEVLADGYRWSEGPLWIESQKMVIFSDVPTNIVYKWTEEKGAEVYLNPSGYTGEIPRGGEMGSNGLLLDKDGNLVLCQHGDRRLARMNAPLDAPKSEFSTIASGPAGKKFNSPNDATWQEGAFYLTDPPYGLVKHETDSSREVPYQGVYRIVENGPVHTLVDSLTKPNGIDFFPDGKRFLVANSDPGKPRWYLYEIGQPGADGNVPVVSGKIFFDAKTLMPDKGLPDGLKIDSNGTVFATGPGGVYVFNQEGKLLGRIKLTNPSSNCALSPDEKTLYVTNNMYLVRIKLR